MVVQNCSFVVFREASGFNKITVVILLIKGCRLRDSGLMMEKHSHVLALSYVVSGHGLSLLPWPWPVL